MPAQDQLISPQLLEILRCPADHTRLRLADNALVARLNKQVSAGKLLNSAGETITTPLDGALVREDGAVAYPIVDRLPRMLADEAIRLESVGE